MPQPLGPTALPVAPPSPPVAQGTPVVGILRGSPFTPMPGVPAGAAIGGGPSHAAHSLPRYQDARSALDNNSIASLLLGAGTVRYDTKP